MFYISFDWGSQSIAQSKFQRAAFVSEGKVDKELLPRPRQDLFETFFEFLSEFSAQNLQRTSFISGVFEAPSVEGSADNAFRVTQHKMFFRKKRIMAISRLLKDR